MLKSNITPELQKPKEMKVKDNLIVEVRKIVL